MVAWKVVMKMRMEEVTVRELSLQSLKFEVEF